MSALRRCWLAVATVVPAACGSLAAQERLAVIAASTEQSRAELERVLSAAFDGQPVALAADALTRNSVLAIERRTPPGPQGRAATGRTLEPPVQFKLVLRDTRCMLVRVADAREWPLTEAQCVPAVAR
ncbi:MAG TPA: hypothetical protein VM692_01445 [Gammaproteobacteria bacterium]|nr:hypothetical protein [Gammaproteobacteria bacterium]